ncbi:hypothetical protein Hanom_Chr04g00285301 [Helianthus anomalus]
MKLGFREYTRKHPHTLPDSRITSCDTSSPGGDSYGAASQSQYAKGDVLTRA